MSIDMTVPCDNGLINIRVGAIILKDGKFLMVGNNIRPEYLYSVGGRIKFGETAEEAVISDRPLTSRPVIPPRGRPPPCPRSCPRTAG